MFPKRKETKVFTFTKKEVLLYNIVEKHFQSYLRPLNLFLSLFIYPKYRIRDNFITPNGWVINVLSFIATSMYVIILLARAFTYKFGIIVVVFNQPKTETVYLGTRYFNFFLNIAGHVTNFIANASHSSSNVLLVLKIQEVCKKLRLNEKNFTRETIINWISVIFVFIAFYVFYGYINTGRGKMKWLDFATDCTLLSFTVNMLYSIRIIILMRNNLTMWTKEIESNKTKKTKKGTQYWKKMLDIYKLILDSYNIYIRVFQEVILYFTADAFLHTLTFIQSWLIFAHTITRDSIYQFYLSSTIILISTWVLVRLLWITILGKVTEEFYLAMEKTQTITSSLLAAPGCVEAERRIYKNVHRLYRARFTKVNLKGLIKVDATLPLNLTNVTMAYIIVLLQFGFIT